MRLRAFGISNFGPIRNIEVADMADVVVFAGPNGVGKTNINMALLNLARNPGAQHNVWVEIEATSDAERTQWRKNVLNTRDANDANSLKTTLQKRQRRNKFQSSFLNFDSDRAIRNVQQYQFSWNIGNPLLEELGWDLGLAPLSGRYNDVRHSLFRMIEAQRREISDQAFALRNSGAPIMNLDFPDILKPFKDAFWQLLAPKRLTEVNIRDQQIYFEFNGQKLNADLLSSGEKEVMNIVFDFILRNPEHCIIIFDEPELHLHPELSYRLLQTLSNIGTKNQFLFSTHSPDIISASLENTVVFVTPPSTSGDNQAIIVHREDATHHALQTLGQSIGVISLGKKIVLIEGDEASLDKQTYGAILKGQFPEFILVPVGGKDTVRSFEDIRDNILDRTIWGVEFYLLCDRDAINALGRDSVRAASTSRVKQLARYHLENYFLDESVFAAAFSQMEPEGSWLRDPTRIKARILEIARSVVPYAVALNVSATIREIVGNVSLMPKGAAEADTPQKLFALMHAKLTSEAKRISAGLDQTQLQSLIDAEFDRLTKAVDNDTPEWRADIPGRMVFNKFAAVTGVGGSGRLKQLYLSQANTNAAFKDIIDIFNDFRSNVR